MSVLVSKDNALKAIEIAFWNEDLGEAVKIVTNNEITQPDIIHCKDCKWHEEHYDDINTFPHWVCKKWFGETVADGFCHKAERRTDEQIW